MTYTFLNHEMFSLAKKFEEYLVSNPREATLVHETAFQRFAMNGNDEPSTLKLFITQDVLLFSTVTDVTLADAETFAQYFGFNKFENRGWTIWTLSSTSRNYAKPNILKTSS